MEFIISPLKGVDRIEFGMSPSDVRRHFDSAPNSFKRTPQASHHCDYFESEGVFFYYDAEGQLEAVEFATPADPKIKGQSLLGLGFSRATAVLSGLDSEIAREIDSAIAYQLGLSIHAPLAKDDTSAPVESVLAFRPGYYN